MKKYIYIGLIDRSSRRWIEQGAGRSTISEVSRTFFLKFWVISNLEPNRIDQRETLLYPFNPHFKDQNTIFFFYLLQCFSPKVNSIHNGIRYFGVSCTNFFRVLSIHTSFIFDLQRYDPLFPISSHKFLEKLTVCVFCSLLFEFILMCFFYASLCDDLDLSIAVNS